MKFLLIMHKSGGALVALPGRRRIQASVLRQKS